MNKRSATGLTPLSVPLIDDPSQPAYVRDLVQAGRDADTGDYDFDQGFSKHLALIASGAPMPPWAEGLKGAPSATGATGAGAAPAAAGASLVGWFAGAAIGVAVVSAAWFISQSGAPAPMPPQVAPAPLVPAQGEPLVPAHMVPAHVVPAHPEANAPQLLEPTSAREPGSNEIPSVMPRSSRSPSQGAHGKHPDRRGAGSVGSLSSNANAPVASADPFASARPPSAAPQVAGERTAPEPARAIDNAAPQPQPANQAQPTEAAAAATDDATPREDSRLEREMAMLSMAQRVLSSDPKRTLSLARQGEAEFPGSMFTQERQQLLLLALVKLGELDEAQRLAKPFLQRYPSGPFSERVRRALAAGKAER